MLKKWNSIRFSALIFLLPSFGFSQDLDLGVEDASTVVSQ